MGGVITRVLFLAVFWIVALISNAQAQTTVVVSSNPLWTTTGIVLLSGDRVTITASGSWSWNGAVTVGPDGGPLGEHFDDFQHFDANDHGRLIGFIGPDPYQGHRETGSGFFPQPTGYISVGSSATFTAATSGPLWLGFNDDAQSAFTFDNVGSVTAVISVAGAVSPPQITSISPTSGVVGDAVAINGSGFGASQGTSTVKFGSTVAAIGSWSNTQIQATVPLVDPGFYDITVTTAAGTSNAVSFRVSWEFRISSQGVEPSLAADPRIGWDQHAVVGFAIPRGGGRADCAWAETLDGGKSWTNPPGVIHLPEDFIIPKGDPWLRYDRNGTLFYSCIGTTEFEPLGANKKLKRVGVFVAIAQNGFASQFGVANPIPDSIVLHICENADSFCQENEPLADHPVIDVLNPLTGAPVLVACWVEFEFIKKPKPQEDVYKKQFLKVASSSDGVHWSSSEILARTPQEKPQACTVGGGSSARVAVAWWDQEAGNLKFKISTNGIVWEPISGPEVLANVGNLLHVTEGPLIGTPVSTTRNVLSIPYALITSTVNGSIRAVLQRRNTGLQESEVLIATQGQNGQRSEMKVGGQRAETFLPGAGICNSLVGAYEVRGDGTLNYKLWDANRDPEVPIFTSSGSINPFAGIDDPNYRPFHRIGDYTAVDCSGGVGWAVWTHAGPAQNELSIRASRVVIR